MAPALTLYRFGSGIAETSAVNPLSLSYRTGFTVAILDTAPIYDTEPYTHLVKDTAKIQKCKYRSIDINNDVKFDAYIRAFIHVDKKLR